MQPTSNEEIEKALASGLQAEKIEVTGDGYNYQTTIISNAFDGLSKVKRHQKIYALLKTYINSGALHALTIQTYTPSEYEKL